MDRGSYRLTRVKKRIILSLFLSLETILPCEKMPLPMVWTIGCVIAYGILYNVRMVDPDSSRLSRTLVYVRLTDIYKNIFSDYEIWENEFMRSNACFTFAMSIVGLLFWTNHGIETAIDEIIWTLWLFALFSYKGWEIYFQNSRVYYDEVVRQNTTRFMGLALLLVAISLPFLIWIGDVVCAFGISLCLLWMCFAFFVTNLSECY